MNGATQPVTDALFEEDVLKSTVPVLVDFWAEWCGPCKMIAPVLEDIAGELQGQVRIVKMNVDENPMTPSKFGIRSIPTMILFRDGKPVATKIGAVPKPALLGWIKESI